MKKVLSVLFLSVLVSVSTLSNNVKACDMVDVNTGDCIVSMGNGDLMNANTGEYIMDVGNGNKIGTESGELYINMGSGDLMNTGSVATLVIPNSKVQ